jgi:hypothetical protein
MVRSLLGLFILAAGLVALASASRETRSSTQETTTPMGNNRLRETETVAVSGTLRTLLLPAPALDLRFSLN